MKILVTGSNGLLGSHLVQLLAGSGHAVTATGRGASRRSLPENVLYRDLDLTAFPAVRDLIRQERPDVLVHAAAMTQVDDCELNREKSRLINVQATENLLEAAAPAGSHFVFLSTDFVFDGEKGHYCETDPVNPVNWYGETKLMAEQAVQQYAGHWSIARTCLLYGNSEGLSRTNIITWIRTALRKGERIRVVNDQVRTPTSVGDFATGIRLVAEQRAGGIFHLSGRETMTPCQLALATAGHFSLDASLIEAVDASTFSQPGRRPLKTGFVIGKAEQVLGFKPGSLQAWLQQQAE
jgi:dTDP-4-dehydrorhamnose reductase